MKENTNYAQTLKSYRKQQTTQLAFAEELGISAIHYTQIENGKGNPSVELHAAICLALNKPSDCFLYPEQQEPALTKEQMTQLSTLPVKKLRLILEIVQSIYEEQKSYK